jgi:hypothetical protein
MTDIQPYVDSLLFWIKILKICKFKLKYRVQMPALLLLVPVEPLVEDVGAPRVVGGPFRDHNGVMFRFQLFDIYLLTCIQL